MAIDIMTLELPITLYDKLQKLAAGEQTDPVDIIARLVETAMLSSPAKREVDPVFELIGAYRSERPLIDDIPVSEDPDLYLAAETLGEQAAERHAWELAPIRYKQGPDRRPLRRNEELLDLRSHPCKDFRSLI